MKRRKTKLERQLLKALTGMLSDYEDTEGEGVCDCQPEPENAGHVCNACLARLAIAKATGKALP